MDFSSFFVTFGWRSVGKGKKIDICALKQNKLGWDAASKSICFKFCVIYTIISCSQHAHTERMFKWELLNGFKAGSGWTQAAVARMRGHLPSTCIPRTQNVRNIMRGSV